MIRKDSSTASFRKIVKVFIKALQVSLHARSKLSLAVGIVGFGMALLPAGISIVLKEFTNIVQLAYGKGNIYRYQALTMFALLVALYLIQTLFASIQAYYASVDNMNIQGNIKETIIHHACEVKYKYIDNYDDFREKIAFVKSSAGARVAGSIGGIFTWLQSLITFITIFLVLSEVNIWITIVLFCASLPAIILAYMQKDEDYRYKAKWMPEGASVIHQFHDCCAQYSLNEVRFFGIFDFLKGKWKNTANLYIGIKNKMTRKHVLYNSIADILRNSIFIIILIIVVKEIFVNPAIGLGAFMLVLTVAGQFQNATARLFIGAAQFACDLKYMENFFDLDELEREQSVGNSTINSTEICFKNVSFTYSGSLYPALSDINVTIPPGQKVAIVGENGSGKTTFVNLLCGMYEPVNGSITLGGEEISKNLHTVRRNLSVIFQDFCKYETSIRENITISDIEKAANDDEISTLTKNTGAYDFIIEQPNRLNEVIGSFNKEGNNLSGGQWQRLAITRAVYRDSAKVMILDEPTAALDPLAEANIYRNFAELTEGKTTIMISHRLGVAAVVDRILVFDGGRIVEDGSHIELMKKEGLYAKMYKAQAMWYK
jgi:ABC-type multidrug transport system fused ATPase/permease subunit